MRLGLSSYTYVWSIGVPGYQQPASPLTILKLLERAAHLGIRVVQLADNLSFETLSQPALRLVRWRAGELGIDLEVGLCGLSRERIQRGLALASQLGSPILRLVLDTDQLRPTPHEVVSTLAEMMPACQRAHVTLAIENHDRFDAATLLGILQAVGSDSLGICLDTANSIGCVQSVDYLLDRLGPHVVNVHLKDYCVFRPPHNKGFVVEGRAAGQGQLDIPALLARLTSLGRDPSVILELWPPPQATLALSMELESAWAEDSIRYLRRFLFE